MNKIIKAFSIKIFFIYFIFLTISPSQASNIKNSAVVFMYHKFGVSKYPSSPEDIDINNPPEEESDVLELIILILEV